MSDLHQKIADLIVAAIITRGHYDWDEIIDLIKTDERERCIQEFSDAIESCKKENVGFGPSVYTAIPFAEIKGKVQLIKENKP